MYLVFKANFKLNEFLGVLHFRILFVGSNILFIPHYFLGLAGMSRRVPDYYDCYRELNYISSTGAVLSSLSIIVFIINIIYSISKRSTLDYS